MIGGQKKEEEKDTVSREHVSPLKIKRSYYETDECGGDSLQRGKLPAEQNSLRINVFTKVMSVQL